MDMAATASYSGRLLLPFRRLPTTKRPLHVPCRRVVARADISSAISTESKAPVVADVSKQDNRSDFNCLSMLACPICHKPLRKSNMSSLTRLECEVCKKGYNSNEAYYDLTIMGGSEDINETKPRSTELFRSPLVSYLYERGWRQNFVLIGFPGAEKEFEMAKKYLKPTFGGTIIDASCGSGLFSRMFSKSGLYKCVIALDYSENMLKQCSEYVKQEGISRENLVIVRADIARLPFESNSVDAVHAGAALHCWPSPSAAVAEISRVLRPGGSFVATTFISDGLYSIFPFSLGRQVFSGVTGQYVATSNAELEDLFKACGFVGITCTRNRLFVMLSAMKPS